MLASAAVSHVIILATALLPACLYMTVFFSPCFQASPTSPVSLDPSRHIVVWPLPHGPIMMLCAGNRMERMAIVDMSASR